MTRTSVFLLALGATALATGLRCAEAQNYTVLHAFTGQDGGEPLQGVVLDHQGFIYGTTATGGAYEGGTLFKSDPSGNLAVLHNFELASGSGPGGGGGSLALYGSTLYGSTGGGGGGTTDCGVIYSIGTDGNLYTALHAFDGTDGCIPSGTVLNAAGYGLVGATAYGGPGFVPGPNDTGAGVLFALTKSGDYKELHAFDGTADGRHPNAVLTDGVGDIFGSMSLGGTCTKYRDGCGTIYEFNLTTHQFTILYTFTGQQDGSSPLLGSIGPNGTLYGVTASGSGTGHFGTLFSLSPSLSQQSPNSTYQLKTLADFPAAVGYPESGPTLTPTGALVGVSDSALYVYNGAQHAILQQFSSPATGQGPNGQPTLAPGAAIIGTTSAGGVPACDYAHLQNSCGVLYRYTAP